MKDMSANAARCVSGMFERKVVGEGLAYSKLLANA